jgi:hypothetical protein
MRLLLTCAGLFLIIVGVAWPIVLVMSYSSEAQLEVKQESEDRKNFSSAWRLLYAIQNHRMTVVWLGMLLLLSGLFI